jgi:hypothetical protein
VSAPGRPLPRIVELGVSALLPRASASAALGDLEEDFRASSRDLTRSGRVAWLALQCASLVVGYWMRRISAVLAATALTSTRGRGAGMWARLHGAGMWARLRGAGPLADLSLAGKSLRRSPGYAAVVVVTLAVGIGLNTAIFTVVNVAMFAPMPYDARISIDMERGGRMAPAVESIPLWRANASLLERVEGYRSEQIAWTEGNEPVLLRVIRATPELPQALGVAPLVGRLFNAEEGGPTSAPLALLSEDLWRRELGADRGVIGLPMTLAETSYTIVGVLSREMGLFVDADVVIPDSFTHGLDGRASAQIFAWLAEGTTFEAAQAQLAGLTAESNQRFGYARLYRPEELLGDQVRLRSMPCPSICVCWRGHWESRSSPPSYRASGRRLAGPGPTLPAP